LSPYSPRPCDSWEISVATRIEHFNHISLVASVQFCSRLLVIPACSAGY
jgi:hypothetical protein